MGRRQLDIACDPAFAARPDDPLTEPIIIWQHWKSRRRDQCLRLTLASYKGRPTVDLRMFFTTETGHMQASKKGITVGIEKLSELRRALEKAEAKAIELDLIEAVG